MDYYDYGIDVKLVKAGDEIKLKRFSLNVLNPGTKHQDTNDDSIVLLGNINNIDMLLMGDASKTIEEELINDYKFGNIDILKVGHHGSATASSAAFLAKVKPKNAIIMNGRVKKFNFPSKITLNNLSSLNINTYCTKESKTIWVRSFAGKFKFYSLA